MQSKNIIGRVLHGCSEVSELIVQNSEVPLSAKQKLLMHTHFLFCKCCKNFFKESAAIDMALKTYFEDMKNEPTLRLSDQKSCFYAQTGSESG